jgi:hypothetical protein
MEDELRSFEQMQVPDGYNAVRFVDCCRILVI